MLRVRVCYKCKVYMIIHPNNPKSKELEVKFNSVHSKHAIQTITWDEITKEYTHVKNLDNDE